MRIIAGPCQHETLEQSLQIAQECKRVCDKHGIEYIFKASFDKDNMDHTSSVYRKWHAVQSQTDETNRQPARRQFPHPTTNTTHTRPRNRPRVMFSNCTRRRRPRACPDSGVSCRPSKNTGPTGHRNRHW